MPFAPNFSIQSRDNYLNTRAPMTEGNILGGSCSDGGVSPAGNEMISLFQQAFQRHLIQRDELQQKFLKRECAGNICCRES